MPHRSSALSEAQLETFIHEGYVRIDEAFDRSLAEECRKLLWAQIGFDPGDEKTWTKPVVRVGQLAQAPFRAAANTSRLTAAFDELVGQGRWLPLGSLGTFPIRFPSAEDPGDCGWHVDPSFGWEDEPDFLEWRTNVYSRGRALLMLFLFSDVSEADAPTRLRAGSHLDVARRLAPHGAGGLTLRELADRGFAESARRSERLAVGPAGTVYLCHPFLVHAAQPHRGRVPRFLAQPPLLPHGDLDPMRSEGELSPVERAIRLAISGG
jgi:hypothetical protein